MHNNYYRFGIALIILFNCLTSQAADVAAGKSHAATCEGCHGQNGNSSNPLFPSLASQGHIYIEAQLSAFREGVRSNPIMQQFAAGLTDTDIQNLAAYFSSQPPKAAGGDANLAKLGKEKTNMCLGCHGTKLSGQAIAPRLAGQQPAYLAKQLHDFKAGARKSGHMNTVAKTLSDEDIQAISAYIATVQ
jgi:cytochrome c553